MNIFKAIVCFWKGHDMDSYSYNPRAIKKRFIPHEVIDYCERCHKEWPTGEINEDAKKYHDILNKELK